MAVAGPVESVRKWLLNTGLKFIASNWGLRCLEVEVHLDEVPIVVCLVSRLMDYTGVIYRIEAEPSRLEWEEYDHWLVRLERIDEAEVESCEG